MIDILSILFMICFAWLIIVWTSECIAYIFFHCDLLVNRKLLWSVYITSMICCIYVIIFAFQGQFICVQGELMGMGLLSLITFCFSQSLVLKPL